MPLQTAVEMTVKIAVKTTVKTTVKIANEYEYSKNIGDAPASPASDV